MLKNDPIEEFPSDDEDTSGVDKPLTRESKLDNSLQEEEDFWENLEQLALNSPQAWRSMFYKHIWRDPNLLKRFSDRYLKPYVDNQFSSTRWTTPQKILYWFTIWRNEIINLIQRGFITLWQLPDDTLVVFFPNETKMLKIYNDWETILNQYQLPKDLLPGGRMSLQTREKFKDILSEYAFLQPLLLNKDDVFTPSLPVPSTNPLHNIYLNILPSLDQIEVQLELLSSTSPQSNDISVINLVE